MTRTKLAMIRAIQDLGYRVLCLQGGGVEVWIRSNPEKVFPFANLSRALTALRKAEGLE